MRHQQVGGLSASPAVFITGTVEAFEPENRDHVHMYTGPPTLSLSHILIVYFSIHLKSSQY